MKQAIAWQIQGLIALGLLTLVWVVLIAVVSLVTTNLKARVRSALIAGTAMSLPSYVAFGMWYPQMQEQMTFEFNTVISENASMQYRELCAAKPSINVRRVVATVEPVDIRIVEPEELYGLEARMPQGGDKSVCWLEKASTACSPSNIRNVEWGYRSRTSDCNRRNSPAGCGVRRFRNDRQGRSSSIESFTSSYALSVSSSERVAPLIEKFLVAVKVVATGEVLADTHIYRRSWFHNARSTANEPPYCPPRDPLVADLLAKVFPVSPDPPAPR